MTAALLELPTEIILLILEKADYLSLRFSLPKVCHRVRELVQIVIAASRSDPIGDPELFRSVRLGVLPLPSPRAPRPLPFRVHPMLYTILLYIKTTVIPPTQQDPDSRHPRLRTVECAAATKYALDENFNLQKHPSLSYVGLLPVRTRGNTSQPHDMYSESIIWPPTSHLIVKLEHGEDFEGAIYRSKAGSQVNIQFRHDHSVMGKLVTLEVFAWRVLQNLRFRTPPGSSGHYVFSVRTGWEDVPCGCYPNLPCPHEADERRVLAPTMVLTLVHFSSRHMREPGQEEFRFENWEEFRFGDKENMHLMEVSFIPEKDTFWSSPS